MNEIVVEGKIDYLDVCNEHYNCTFHAVLQKSKSFCCGYKTFVTITYGLTVHGYLCKPDYIDITYDRSIRITEEDFKDWLCNYFNLTLSEHDLTFFN